MASTCSKQLTERDSDGNNNKLYANIIDNLCVIVHGRRSQSET